MEEPWQDTDRGGGVLTDTQREKLLEGELSRRDRNNIRNQIENTLYDFKLLNDYLSDRDRLQVLYPDAVDWKNKNDDVVLDQLAAQLAEGHLFQSKLARGVINVVQFLEETVMYRENPGLGQMADATGDVDWGEVFGDAAQRIEEGENTPVEMLLAEQAQEIDALLRQQTDEEARWGDVDEVLEALGINQEGSSD